jgi:hypothetical protein
MWMLRSRKFWVGCVIFCTIFAVIGNMMFDFTTAGLIVYSIFIGLVYGISYDITDGWIHPYHRRQS